MLSRGDDQPCFRDYNWFPLLSGLPDSSSTAGGCPPSSELVAQLRHRRRYSFAGTLSTTLQKPVRLVTTNYSARQNTLVIHCIQSECWIARHEPPLLRPAAEQCATKEATIVSNHFAIPHRSRGRALGQPHGGATRAASAVHGSPVYVMASPCSSCCPVYWLLAGSRTAILHRPLASEAR